ncbi:serine protease inhibitor 88Ea-like [Nylanderia fulva]|uniref:serine protease inhibitor 88Ea-like n=1 Tax=Nylanderia fulva TaxID=613905 RepID=UPI0010FAF588|nr:serine protease inhibitor 88Ea-like [Nylanderia fulva]
MENKMTSKEATRIKNILKEMRFQFAFKCLNDIMKINPKENIAFSPPCIYKGLLITYLMVKGDIEERLKNILLLTEISKQDLINYRGHIKYSKNVSMDNPECYSYDVKCFIKPNIQLQDTLSRFMHTAATILDSSTNSEHLINNINDKILKNAVHDYMSDSSSLAVVRPDTEFTLMTAIHGRFQKFQYLAAVEADIETIASRTDDRRISYFHKYLGIHVNEHYYQSRQISLFVFRPASLISGQCRISKYKDSRTNICALIEQLLTSEGFSELHKVLDRSETLLEKVETPFILLPSFEVEKNLTIRELLLALGAKQLLEPDAIDLDPSTVEGDQLSVRIGNVMHRSQVKVTQKDISASAITLIHTGRESSPSTEIENENCNHPFVWLIYDKKRREVLYIGAFNKFASAVPKCQWNIQMEFLI